MTTSQRLEVRASEIRERLNELSGVDALTEEQRAELGDLTTEYRDVEAKRRAAIIAEGPTEPQAADAPDAEARERAELRERVSMVDYIDAASQGKAVDGAASEYNASLEIRADHFPLSLLAPEERATTDVDGSVSQGSWIDRLFADSAASALGVTMASVSPGQVTYPVVTAGASAAQRGRTEAAADAAWTVGTTSIEPTRNSVRAVFSRTDALRLPGLEEALRRDLRMALTEGIDKAIFSGDAGANENVADITGFTGASITELTLTQAAKIVAATVLARFVNLVDGVYAGSLSDLNVVLFTGAYRLWASTIANSDADNQTILRFLADNGLSATHRGGIETATDNGDFGAVVGLGRGIQNAAVAAVWESASLIRDPYSGSAKGEVALTLHTHWGFKLPRAANFRRIKFVT